jgi:transposase
MDVAIGIDAHKETLAAAAVDVVGRVLVEAEFRNDPSGHKRLLVWVNARPGTRRVGIEGSGSYGAGVARVLLAAGEDVREVPTSLSSRERQRRPTYGKSDPIDAVAIARVVARDEPLGSPARVEALTELKLLCDYRDEAVRTRTRLANQAHMELVIMRPGYQEKVPNLRAKGHVTAALMLIRRDRSVRADLVRRRIAAIRRLEREIADTNKQIAAKVKATGTTLVEIPGVGPLIAAKILGEVGDVRRIRSKAAFGHLSGTAPVLASSGGTHRHRLNRGGNRQLNWALHYVALVQWRSCSTAKEYVVRHRAAGKSHKEAMRCLKRQLANVIYRTMVNDLRIPAKTP